MAAALALAPPASRPGRDLLGARDGCVRRDGARAGDAASAELALTTLPADRLAAASARALQARIDAEQPYHPDELLCFRCEAWKTAPSFPESRNAARGRKGRASWCQACIDDPAIRARGTRAGKPDAPPPRPTTLYCTRCKLWKPDERFARHSRATTRRGRQSRCRDCTAILERERRARDTTTDGSRQRQRRLVAAVGHQHPGELLCTRCERWRPDDDFLVRADGAAAARRGRGSHCRGCRAEAQRKRRSRDGSIGRKGRAGRKRCWSCELGKPAVAFDGKAKRCAECSRSDVPTAQQRAIARTYSEIGRTRSRLPRFVGAMLVNPCRCDECAYYGGRTFEIEVPVVAPRPVTRLAPDIRGFE